jgi:hypothetical protein
LSLVAEHELRGAVDVAERGAEQAGAVSLVDGEVMELDAAQEYEVEEGRFRR